MVCLGFDPRAAGWQAQMKLRPNKNGSIFNRPIRGVSEKLKVVLYDF